jgi:hypothetical protein
MRKILSLLALLALLAPLALLAAPAFAGDFACTVQPDGKSLTVSVTNPHKAETHCQVHCEFSTGPGSTYMAECGKTVPPGVETVLCSKVYERGQLGKQVSGTVDCIKTLAAEEETAAEKDEEAPDLSDPKVLEKLRQSVPAGGQKIFDQAVKPNE